MDDQNRATVRGVIQRAHDLLAKVGFKESEKQARFALNRLNAQPNFDYSTACTNLEALESTILSDLSSRHYLQVSVDRERFFPRDNNRPFTLGDDVARAFPSAVDDIHEAGYCMAVEANTAAVYHLMCTVEHGLRALAKDRRVKVKKNRPIEMEQWGDIVKKLEDKVKEIDQWPASLVREQAREFYNLALKDSRSFNEAYRKHIAHARRHYDRNEALSVMEHVSHFMQTLAHHISEKKVTPERWRRIRPVANGGRVRP